MVYWCNKSGDYGTLFFSDPTHINRSKVETLIKIISYLNVSMNKSIYKKNNKMIIRV